MWCPDDIGRDSWVWVVAPSQGESMTHFPRSGVVSPRRKNRIAVSKRDVPTMKWLNVLYSLRIIVDEDVDLGRLRLDYEKCSPNGFRFQKNQFRLRKTMGRQIGPQVVVTLPPH